MATKIHCEYCKSSQPRLRSLYPVYDFDVSREWFVHEPLLPCDFSKLKHFNEMEPRQAKTTPVPDTDHAGDSNFAGPQYDATKQDWVEGHILGNDGSVSPAVQDRWLGDISDHLQHPESTEIDVHRAAQALQAIKQVGTAAGKLYLKGRNNVDEYLDYTASGFCLEHRFFLTAAHWNSIEKADNRIFQPNNGIVHISIASQSNTWASVETDEKDLVRPAYLIHRDICADFALFHIDPKTADFPRTLVYNALQALPNPVLLNDLPTSVIDRIWTVGYAGDNGERFEVYLDEQRKTMPDEKAVEIFRKKKEARAHAYLFASYG